MQFCKPSQEGIQQIYQAQDKRHHATIYNRAMNARQCIMEAWCAKINGDPQELCQGLCNDLEGRREFNTGISNFMVYKLNMAISNVNPYHQPTNNLDMLVREYTELTGLMYYGNQYGSSTDIKVV